MNISIQICAPADKHLYSSSAMFRMYKTDNERVSVAVTHQFLFQMKPILNLGLYSSHPEWFCGNLNAFWKILGYYLN